jgi:hypothetical protein
MALDRKTKNMVVLAKVETTAGTDAVPTGSANAVLTAGDVTLQPVDAQAVPRTIRTGYFGSSGSFMGSAWMRVAFGVEMAGSGTAGTAPAWGALLQGCAFAEAVTAGQRVDYTPVSTGLKTLTIYAYADGLEHRFIGAMGSLTGSALVNGVPVLQFEFWAPYLAPTAVANPSLTLTAWKLPELVNDTNTADLVLGGAYSAGAISGGTAYPSGGIEFNTGNQVARTELIGAKRMTITDRAVSGSIRTVDLSAAQEIALQGKVVAGTQESIGIVHGTGAGKKVILFFPQANYRSFGYADVDGVLTASLDFDAPPLSGNDDMRIVVL